MANEKNDDVLVDAANLMMLLSRKSLRFLADIREDIYSSDDLKETYNFNIK